MFRIVLGIFFADIQLIKLHAHRINPALIGFGFRDRVL